MASLTFDIFARDKTGQAFASVKNNVDGLNKGFDKVGKTIGAFKTLLMGAFAVNYFKGAAQAAEQINDLSTKLGVSAEVLSQYQLVANNTGVSLDEIGGAMQKLAKSSIDAVESGGEAARALEYLGINAQQFAAMPIDTKFQTLATAIQGVENPSKRVELAMTLMGRSGADMLQVMAGGGEALQEMQARADELGITLRQTQVTAIDGMMDSFGELGLAAKGLAQDFVAALAPAIQWVVEKITWAISKFQVFDQGMTKIGWGIVSLGNKIGVVSDETYKFATIEAFERINKDAKDLNDSLGKQDALLKKIQAGMKTSPVSKSIKKGQKDIEDTGKVAKIVADKMQADFGKSSDAISSDMSQALNGISIDFKDLRGTAVNALNSIGDAILKNIVNQMSGLGNAAAATGGGGGFSIGGIGDLLGSIWDALPSFAGGGDHAGGLRVVGENGPELEATGRARIFNAGQTKTILEGVRSGGDGNIQVTYNIDARGAEQGVETRIMKVLQQVNASVESRAVAAVANAKHRNPNLF